MKIRDISQEQIVLEAPVGVLRRSADKLASMLPGISPEAKRKNFLNSEINRVWREVKKELAQELKVEYIPVNYFLEVMKQLGYLNSAKEVLAAGDYIQEPEAVAEPEAAPAEEPKKKPDTPFGDWVDESKKVFEAAGTKVFSKKDIQELIKQIITNAAEKHPDEFMKRVVSKSSATSSQEKPASSQEKPSKNNREKAKGSDTNVSGGDIDPKPFKKAFQKAKSRVIPKVPSKDRDAVYDELQDIFRELYGEL